MDQKAIYERFPDAAERDVLRALFFHGPLFDGDIPSKAARTELHRRGFVARQDGWSTLTPHGFATCITVGLGAEKEAWENKRRAATANNHEAMMLAYGCLWGVGVDTDTAPGSAISMARKALRDRLENDARSRGITLAGDLMKMDANLSRVDR